MSTPVHLLMVTNMEDMMAILVEPTVGKDIDGDNEAMLELIENTDGDKVYTTITEIAAQLKMYDLEIVGEDIGAIY